MESVEFDLIHLFTGPLEKSAAIELSAWSRALQNT